MKEKDRGDKIPFFGLSPNSNSEASRQMSKVRLKKLKIALSPNSNSGGISDFLEENSKKIHFH